MTGAHVHCCLLQVSGLGAGQLVAGVERVPGLTWRSVASVADVLGVLAEGNRGRATAATALNAHSSRCAWDTPPAYGNPRPQRMGTNAVRQPVPCAQCLVAQCALPCIGGGRAATTWPAAAWAQWHLRHGVQQAPVVGLVPNRPSRLRHSEHKGGQRKARKVKQLKRPPAGPPQVACAAVGEAGRRHWRGAALPSSPGGSGR